MSIFLIMVYILFPLKRPTFTKIIFAKHSHIFCKYECECEYVEISEYSQCGCEYEYSLHHLGRGAVRPYFLIVCDVSCVMYGSEPIVTQTAAQWDEMPIFMPKFNISVNRKINNV